MFSAAMKGSSEGGQPTWNEKVIWVWLSNKYLVLLTMFVHWFLSPSHASENVKENVFLV